MMDIKFRGLNGKKFHFGYFINTNICSGIVKYSDINLDSDNGKKFIGDILVTPVKKETVGQFTGLKDKNGVDIYEGDILNVGYNRIGNILVSFKNGSYNISKYSLDDCHVIGNIHQNPELLK